MKWTMMLEFEKARLACDLTSTVLAFEGAKPIAFWSSLEVMLEWWEEGEQAARVSRSALKQKGEMVLVWMLVDDGAVSVVAIVAMRLMGKGVGVVVNFELDGIDRDAKAVVEAEAEGSASTIVVPVSTDQRVTNTVSVSSPPASCPSCPAVVEAAAAAAAVAAAAVPDLLISVGSCSKALTTALNAEGPKQPRPYDGEERQ
ncbi:MAG: hypothetical protein M1827_005858 [Pycnora praestabilis]|nr:MAG: hypothetical protein M1827_005858 [Pycnora praestabilis]